MMQDFFNWQGVVGTILGAVGVIFSVKAFLESRKAKRLLEEEKNRFNEPVKLILTDGSRKHEILPPLSRREFSRSEIQGRLGTVPMKEKKLKYEIKYTSEIGYYEQITAISKGSNKDGNDKMIIRCSQPEYDQFDFEEKPAQIKEDAQTAAGEMPQATVKTRKRTRK